MSATLSEGRPAPWWRRDGEPAFFRSEKTPIVPELFCFLVISLRSALKLSFERIDRPERKFGSGIHISNARVQLQKILPRAILVSLGTGLVIHADDHSQNPMA
jgi:hypothetical protein